MSDRGGFRLNTHALASGALLAAAIVAGTAAAACSSSAPASDAVTPASAAAADAAVGPHVDLADQPVDGLGDDVLADFQEGDTAFGLPLRDADGLGPLYIRASCGACHTSGLRGPGFVQKMSVVLADGITPAPDQTSVLAYGPTERPNVAAGAKTPIAAPSNVPNVRVSTRVGPSVLGRGYMEAVLDSEIERMEREQSTRTDGIHGRINHVLFQGVTTADARFHTMKKGDPAIGRFGFKARVSTLDDFTADALLGDMGITNPLRPDELPNPDHLTDDDKPGVDVGLASVAKRANYMRLIAIPRRETLSDAGKALFAQAKCDVCHAPSLKTRSDYPFTPLANIDAPVYTDFLLHDMGDGLADGLSGADGQAGPRDWRSAPLIGLRFYVTFLHDSRAHSIREAIELHGGPGSEANDSVATFSALSSADQQTLLDFVTAL